MLTLRQVWSVQKTEKAHLPEWHTSCTQKLQQDHHSSTLCCMFDSRVRSKPDVMDVHTLPNAAA